MSNSNERVCHSTVRPLFVQSLCNRYNHTTGSSSSHIAKVLGHRQSELKHFVVNDRHRVLFCQLGKVASTTFDTLLVSSASNLSIADIVSRKDAIHFVHGRQLQQRNGIRRLDTYTEAEARYRFENYFKFMAVRHPLDRLVSAWRDKKESRITSGKFRHPDAEQLGRFRRFVRQVASGKERNIHWRSYYTICHPCDIQYDSVIRLETMQQDMPLLLAKLPGPDGKPNVLPTTNQMSPIPPSAKLRKLSEYYSGVDSVVMRRLQEMYDLDFRLYGYTWNTKKSKAACDYGGVQLGAKSLESCNC